MCIITLQLQGEHEEIQIQLDLDVQYVFTLCHEEFLHLKSDRESITCLPEAALLHQGLMSCRCEAKVSLGAELLCGRNLAVCSLFGNGFEGGSLLRYCF